MIILFSKLDGAIFDGKRYDNGKITHVFNAGNGSWSPLKAGAGTFSMCIHTVAKGLLSRSNPFSDQECRLAEDSSNWGWCFACWKSHNPGEDPEGYTPPGQPTPVAANDSLPKTYPKQETPETCTANAIAFNLKAYGVNKTEAQVVAELKGKGYFSKEEGVKNSQIGHVMYMYFDYKSISTSEMQSEINAGRTIQTNMGGHSVTVTDYCEDQYRYMEPDDGIYHYAPIDSFGSGYCFSIMRAR